MKRWYVLQVITNTEDDCAQQLRGMGMSAIVPSRIVPELTHGRWTERERRMMPGYVFVQTDMSVTDYYRIAGIPNAVRILPGRGLYHPVPEHQMRWIMELSNNGEPWAISEGMEANGQLRVLSGSLVGKEDRVLRWDKRRRRAKIEIRILDQRHIIDVGLIQV